MSRWIVFAVMLTIIARSASGAVGTKFYEVELAGAARDEASRGEEFRRALSVVLGRVISPEAMESKAGLAILGRAGDFVEQYEFLPQQGSGGVEMMRIRFDDEGLRNVLRRAGIGVWEGNRPELVVWLWVQDEGGRYLVNLQESPDFDRPLRAAAEHRWISVTAPLGDLTDQTSLTWTDAETGNQGRIREATRRYDSDTALVGLLRRSTEGQWDAVWRFAGLGDTAEWRTHGPDRGAALQSGIDGAYGRLVKLYAPTAREENVVELQIEGIASMSEAGRCGDYLRGLPLVKRADWIRAEADGATWRLTVAGRIETLRRILAASRVLQPVTAADGQSLVYRWTP